MARKEANYRGRCSKNIQMAERERLLCPELLFSKRISLDGSKGQNA
ncbi:hypothetical protein B4168_0176 [Anoxybacillus flavithermus]|nr:hypothetical protein B4168_0176 [Anoxybacillus flavithermus]OAO88905.1 hypothetical protein GT23_0145 [Parageobacillus thermoglucosidasius]